MFDIVKAGEQMTSLRKAKGLTQEALAEKLGVSPQAVSKWENGHTMPEAALLPELSEIFGCTVDRILSPGEAEGSGMNPKYIHMLLPYREVSPYTGAWWPRSMAFPAVMTALKLFMGLEERCDYSGRQVNDDQEYILQAGLSTQAFGLSYYPAQHIDDCFTIYGLSYESISLKDKPRGEVMRMVTTQLHMGYPVVLQSGESEYLFVTGFVSGGNTVKAHLFIEGYDEKNCNMNPYEMEDVTEWLKPDMQLLFIRCVNQKLDLGQACRNALARYVDVVNDLTAGPLAAIDEWIGRLESDEKKKVKSLRSFSPRECILYESVLRTSEFLDMCRQLASDVQTDSLNSAIGKYRLLVEHSRELYGIVAGKGAADKTVSEKRSVITNYLTRIKEILTDAAVDIRKAVN